MTRFHVNLWYGDGLFSRDRSKILVEARDIQSLREHLEQYKDDTAAFMPNYLQDDEIPANLKLRRIEVFPEYVPPVNWNLESIERSEVEGVRYYED